MTPNVRRAIGANPWIWHSPVTDKALEEVLPRLAAWGFDCAELPLEQPGDWQPATTAGLLADQGLTPAAVCAVMPPGRDLVRATPTVVRTTQDYLRQCVDAAALLGAPVVAGPVYAAVGHTWQMDDGERTAAYEQWRENIAPVVTHAAQTGIRIAVEPLNRYETSLFNTIDQTVAAMDGLSAQTIGVALDTYHQNIEERSLPDAVRRATGRIFHVQVCANDRGAPGDDHLDWPGFLDALDDEGHQGPLCIESFTAHNATIAVAASIWRPLAPSQDDLATRGLAFLRQAERRPTSAALPDPTPA